MADYDLKHELIETIARYKVLAEMMADDPTVAKTIEQLLSELEAELNELTSPLAPRHQGDAKATASR